MDTSRTSARRFDRVLKRFSGFSLVEVTLAIGIVASAVVVVVGLFPSGMNTFRQAMNASVGGQIAQQLISEAQQTDFDTLRSPNNIPVAPDYDYPVNTTFNKLDRYFDDQGGETMVASPGAPSAVEKLKIVYWVRTRVSPRSDLPNLAKVPGAGNPEIVNSKVIATVVIQIANNPSNQPLAQEAGTADDSNSPLRNLWSGAFQSDPTKIKVVPNNIYSTLVSRNQ